MLTWVLGEKKYAYALVESSTPVTISSASYQIFDTADESVVASGVAGITGQTVYCLWEPSETGVYTVRFNYVIDLRTFAANQVIEVKDTM